MYVLSDIRDITTLKRDEEKIRRSYYFQSTMSSVLKTSLEPLSLDEQLERVLDLVLLNPSLAERSQGCIYLVEEEAKVLVMKAHRGLNDAVLEKCSRVSFGECTCGMTASTGEVMFGACTVEHPEDHKTNLFPHGHFCIPIIFGGRVLGIINLVINEKDRKDSEEEKLLCSIADTLAGIIERDRTEQEKDKPQSQFIQSEKLSALGRLTANVAHEIRNPLTTLGGFAKLFNRNISEGSKEKEYSEIIISEAARLERILRSVLTLTKDTLLNNIVSNSIDAMPNGGDLSITTGTRSQDREAFVTVDIADTGGGIPEDQLRRVFEPFFTTRAVGLDRGIGLGLSIGKKIMEQHGGFIRVESRAGEGSTFRLFFPSPTKSADAHSA